LTTTLADGDEVGLLVQLVRGRRTEKRALAAAALIWALASTSAVAQEAADPATPSDPAVRLPPAPVGVGTQAAGPGFALSEDRRSRLHLGVDAGAGLDTNPFSVPLAENEFAGDLIARVRPRARIDYPGSTLAFQGLAFVDYGVLPGIINERTRQLLLYQSLVSGDLELNRGGALRFAVGDSFSWNSDPGNASLGVLFNRINNQLRAGAGFKPGGGALDFRLGYSFDFTKFLDVQGGSGLIAAGVLDSMLHTVQMRADYKFLPRTGLFGVVRAGWSSYPFSQVNPQSFPVTALVGVQGQILAKLAGLASIGYSNPLVYDTPPGGGQPTIVTAGLLGVVGQAEVQWQPSPLTRLGGGFQRTFAPAPLYQYVGNNRMYASVNQLLAGRFQLVINSGYSILEFGEEQLNITTARVGRLDGHLDFIARLSYYFTDWFSVGIVDNLDWRLTNANDIDRGTSFAYIRNQTLVLASLSY
jgi:hypothetical protein